MYRYSSLRKLLCLKEGVVTDTVYMYHLEKNYVFIPGPWGVGTGKAGGRRAVGGATTPPTPSWLLWRPTADDGYELPTG